MQYDNKKKASPTFKIIYPKLKLTPFEITSGVKSSTHDFLYDMYVPNLLTLLCGNFNFVIVISILKVSCVRITITVFNMRHQVKLHLKPSNHQLMQGTQIQCNYSSINSNGW